ncbi:helix-turn-helix domain-containing protein [Amycolatopsis umgeniensis]|uniref:Transcriptional regulator with XRE-family HTH domain n=1 Tax=Amycolatopsis umgeniensis TaxID=336628 RepID=A0A841B3P6_9PSEU|nr:helix-turn-helix transcriptional regulator [Amycolatopsis umgeniensis]MBB5853947.1 transcriptional regulator with XRE-family HTH domain [Amycolatopsis umgeniensis]
MADGQWWTYLQGQLEQRGWKPAHLARAAGVSESRISDWRNRGSPPTIPNARAVAEALGEPLVPLLVGAGLLAPGEARQSLAAYSVRELLDEIDARFREVTPLVPDLGVKHPTSSRGNPLQLVADSPSTEPMRVQQEREWLSEAERPDEPGPDTGA